MKIQLSLFAMLLGLISGSYAADEGPKASEENVKSDVAMSEESPKSEENASEKSKEDDKGLLAKLFSKSDDKAEEKKEEAKDEAKSDDEKKPDEIAVPSEGIDVAGVKPAEPSADSEAPKA